MMVAVIIGMSYVFITLAFSFASYNKGRASVLRECSEQIIKCEEKRLKLLVEKEFYRNAYEHEAKLFKALERAHSRLQQRLGGGGLSGDDSDWWKKGSN